MSTSVCERRELTGSELMARVRKVTRSSLPTGSNPSAVDGNNEGASVSDAYRVQAEFNRRVVESLDAVAALCAQMETTLQSVQERLQAAEAISAATQGAMADGLGRAERRLANDEERVEQMAGQFWDICRRLDDLIVRADAQGPEMTTPTESKSAHWGWWNRLQGLWLRA